MAQPKVPAELAKMRWELMFVTPEKAVELLENANEGNRNLSELQVARIADDIRRARWLPTHEGLCIDEHGRIADGQHRLKAIAESRVGVWIWVCFGLPAGNAIAINEGRVRRLKDAMRFREGDDMNSKVESVTRTMMDPTFDCNYSRAQQVKFYLMHEEKILLGQQILTGLKSKIRAAHLSAVITRSLYTQPEFSVRRLAEILRTSERRTAGETAIIMMRDEALDPPRRKLPDMSDTQFRRWWYWRVEYLAHCYFTNNRKPAGPKSGIAKRELFPIHGEADFDALQKSKSAA